MKLESYRVAYEQAAVELTEIAESYDQLRRRKETLERLVAALKPLLEMNGPAHIAVPEKVADPIPAQTQESELLAEPAPVASEESAEQPAYSFLEVPAPLPELPPGPSDPFQRRVFRFRGVSGEHRGMQRGA
jgi:hypothetical protein